MKNPLPNLSLARLTFILSLHHFVAVLIRVVCLIEEAWAWLQAWLFKDPRDATNWNIRNSIWMNLDHVLDVTCSTTLAHGESRLIEDIRLPT